MKKLALLACTAFVFGSAMSAFAQDCKPAHKFETVKPGAITVAAINFPPYGMVAADGGAAGIDGDILKEIARMECLDVNVIPVDGAAALNYVTSSRADIAYGDWYRTKARTAVMNFSDPLYLDQVAVVSKDGSDTIKALESKTVGTMQGNFYVADLKKVLGPKLKLYPSLVAIQQDLMSGRIDAYPESFAATMYAKSKGQLEGFDVKLLKPDPRVPATAEPSQVGYPMRKESTDMLEAFNADLAELHKNGFIVKVLESYGIDPSAANTGAPRFLE